MSACLLPLLGKGTNPLPEPASWWQQLMDAVDMRPEPLTRPVLSAKFFPENLREHTNG
jgi:hypothetical protein